MSANAPENDLYRLFHDLYLFLDAADRLILEPYQLNRMQFTLLTLLDPFEGQHLVTLSDRLICARSTVTRAIEVMKQAGLVMTPPDPEDDRAYRVVLTEKGSQLRAAVMQAHHQSLKARFGALEHDDYQQITQLLEQIRGNVLHYLATSTEGGDKQSQVPVSTNQIV
jgi:DNA-binding MarR family transcriptional regulator